jgi:UDP-N-acetylmuramate: L-alanyl-gamma-D-glutamyl-meso-diaminopimelate ligase
VHKIHFIAIGGAAMHNLALALHAKGYSITGSDDEINEPSRSRLQKAGLLPDQMGWFPEKLASLPEAVILGMHARVDNPELQEARRLGLKIYSYPEYLYEQSKTKLRIVIGGSHGKTSITAMVMHVLKNLKKDFDYMVGSGLEGFDTMVKLTDSAPVIILEGDEYLSSPVDRRPKFHLYQAHIGLLSGIAWDHINVFPTFDNYVEQFRIFAKGIPDGGTLIYYKEDPELIKIANSVPDTIEKIPYGVPEYRIEKGTTFLKYHNKEYPLQVFGLHNLANIEGAKNICIKAGVDAVSFYETITTFRGAARRLELVSRENDKVIFRDFAHSPSKLKATIEAVKEQFPDWKILGCMELHTFSSLSEDFLKQYRDSMKSADIPVVYFNPHTLEHKKLPPLSSEQVKSAFYDNRINVFTDSKKLKDFIKQNFEPKTVLLLMSSGTFDGMAVDQF